MANILLLDFDFTLCDSSVRENAHTKNDVLDLQSYINDTAKHDKALPLLYWLTTHKRQVSKHFDYIAILTNRDFFRPCESKIKGVALTYFDCLHRGIWGAIYGDNFKAYMLAKFCKKHSVTFIDDEPKYLQIARDNGARAICARDLWHFGGFDFVNLLLS